MYNHRNGADGVAAQADSTGSAVVVRRTFETGMAGVSALGEPGRPAEAVAETAEAAVSHSDGLAAVDARLADQLLPFLALCGGSVLAPRATDHVLTCRALLAEFGYVVEVTERVEAVLLSSPGGS